MQLVNMCQLNKVVHAPVFFHENVILELQIVIISGISEAVRSKQESVKILKYLPTLKTQLLQRRYETSLSKTYNRYA